MKQKIITQEPKKAKVYTESKAAYPTLQSDIIKRHTLSKKRSQVY